MLAGKRPSRARPRKSGSRLITVGCLLVGIAATFYGVEHFSEYCVGFWVPLEKLMPAWIPGDPLISYLNCAIFGLLGQVLCWARSSGHGGYLSRDVDGAARVVLFMGRILIA